MTMTLADVTPDDGVMGPRADRPKRRTFTAEYKAKILAEYDAADRGVRGVILRREGLHSSHIIEWRRAVEAGATLALGRKVKDRRDREIELLRKRAEKAEAELAGLTSTKQACDLLGRARGSHYRDKSLRPVREPALRPAPPNKLTDTERAEVLGVLTSPRFCDKSVAQTWAALLDEGTYLCSMSTMHRLLRENEAAGERRPGGPSAAEEARADGHQGWAGVVMGHHQAPWPNPRGLVRPLRCARHLLPVRRGLDDRGLRGRRHRQSHARGSDGRARHPRRAARAQAANPAAFAGVVASPAARSAAE